LVSMSSADIAASAAASAMASVIDAVMTGPATAEPSGMPAKLRLMEMANARPNNDGERDGSERRDQEQQRGYAGKHTECGHDLPLAALRLDAACE